MPEEVIRRAVFGWCLTNNCAGCSGKAAGIECSCNCHSKKKEGQKKRSVKRK